MIKDMLVSKIEEIANGMESKDYANVINDIKDLIETSEYLISQKNLLNVMLSAAESASSTEYKVTQILKSLELGSVAIQPSTQLVNQTAQPVNVPAPKIKIHRRNQGQNQTRPAQAAAPNQAQAAPTGQSATSAASATNPPTNPTGVNTQAPPANAQPTTAAPVAATPAANAKPDPLYKRIARYFT